ncbi:MAG: GNAT family N-acetyltransferase [Dehalococcoidia bacterium]
MDGVEVKRVETELDLEGAIAVRMRVFVVEQQIPAEEELDEADATATHAIALFQGQVIGTGRLIEHDADTAQIGRMAVDQPWRRRGVGGMILQFLEQEARQQGMRRCLLHAQDYVKSFYAAQGYEEHGDIFLEVDIPHIEMRKEL